MELIHIRENNINTTIYIDDKKYYGYRYIDNHVESVDNLDVMKLFILSKDYTKLSKYQKYDVYLDNQTGLKHYFCNEIENINLLFSNNGIYAINYQGKNHQLSDNKIFNFHNRLIICTLLGLTLALGSINLPAAKVVNSVNILINDYEISDIKKMIDSSPYLTTEEKEYLYNEQFINDYLDIINSSYYEKNKVAECFQGISIVGYNNIEHDHQAGYYSTNTPSTLYVKDYKSFDESKKGTLAHEYAHLNQTISGYNLIFEASADIITKEYFYQDYKFSYSTQVKLLKKMMEIIGPYPVWYYNFTGDFSKIEERVMPYLTPEEYQKFLNDLSFDYDNNETNKPKYKELNEILDNLYYAIYQEDIKEDEIITLIEKDNKNLVRYYFNQSMINEENSYYLDYENGTYETISYNDAVAMEIIKPYTITYIEISTEEALQIIEDNSYNLRRDLNFHSHDITIQYSRHGQNKYTISGIIDGEKYEDVNVDDLVKEGLVEVTYYIIDRKDLTIHDYETHNYKDDEIYFIREMYTNLNDENVEYLVPKKIYLQPVNQRYENKLENIKKKKIT